MDRCTSQNPHKKAKYETGLNLLANNRFFQIVKNIQYQIDNNKDHKEYEGLDMNLEVYRQSIQTSEFLQNSLFNLAHWLFAFNYWAFSWRLELIKKTAILHKTAD